jgi:HPt (histidine-containing phosphotransfer) domain-containing protein
VSDEDLDAELAALRAAYARELPGKARAVAAATRAVVDDPKKAEEATAVAHRLRGTAGAYGFPAISQAAAAIEDALHAGARDASLIALADAMEAAGDALKS